MQADVAPRRLTDLTRFLMMLSLFRGQEVDVEYVAIDRDAEVFFNEICSAVRVSEWTLKTAVALNGPTWDGVIVEVNDLREAMPAAYELARLLRQQGTKVVITQRPDSPNPNRFKVRVGYKVPGRVIH